MSRWRYDREFAVNTPLPVNGKVRVAFEMFAPLDDDDPLRGLFAWIRLVIWTDTSGIQIPHVNMSSYLWDLLRANLQTFSDSKTAGQFALYLTNYESPKFETREGDAPWKGEITPPGTFLEYLDREERRRGTREGRAREEAA